MAVYTSSQSINLDIALKSISIQLYGAGGGGEGVSNGSYSAGGNGTPATFLGITAYGGQGGGQGGNNSGGGGGSYDLSNWASIGAPISGTSGGNGSITSGGAGGGANGGNGATDTGLSGPTISVSFTVTRDAGDEDRITFNGPNTFTFTNNNTGTFSQTVYTNTNYSLSTYGSGPGGQALQIQAGGTRIGLDDRIGAGNDNDYNDIAVSANYGYFFQSGGTFYYRVDASGSTYYGRGGGSGGYVTTTITRAQLVANGYTLGSSYPLTVGAGGSRGSGGTTIATAGADGYAVITIDFPKPYHKKDGQWKKTDNIYIKQEGTWKDVKRGFIKESGVWRPFFGK